MKTGKFRFGAFLSSRGICRCCNEKHQGFLIRLKSPIKREMLICYECLIKYLLSFEHIIKSAEKARKRIKRYEQKQAEKAAFVKPPC